VNEEALANLGGCRAKNKQTINQSIKPLIDLFFNHVHIFFQVVHSIESLVRHVFCPTLRAIQGDSGRKLKIGEIMLWVIVGKKFYTPDGDTW
jgi:phage-related protein